MNIILSYIRRMFIAEIKLILLNHIQKHRGLEQEELYKIKESTQLNKKEDTIDYFVKTRYHHNQTQDVLKTILKEIENIK